MSRLKRLVVEVHRRSVWQVLLIYAGGSWVVFEVVQTLTEGLGLPGWAGERLFFLMPLPMLRLAVPSRVTRATQYLLGFTGL